MNNFHGFKNSIAVIFIFTLFIRCSPCFNTMQTARMLKPKSIEITPSYTDFRPLDRNQNWSQENYGGRIGIGLTSNISLYSHYGVIGAGLKNGTKYRSKMNMIATGLKINKTKPVNNKTLAALYLPVGAYYKSLNEGFDVIYIQPTMILTKPIIKKVDWLSSTVLVLSKAKEGEISPFIAQNIGLDFHITNNRLSVRTELGIGIGGSKPVYQYSIGISFSSLGYTR